MRTTHDSAVLKPLGRLLACAAAVCLCAAGGCVSPGRGDGLSAQDHAAIDSAVRAYDCFLHDDSEARIAPGLPDDLTVRQKRALTFAQGMESLEEPWDRLLHTSPPLSLGAATAIEFAKCEARDIAKDFRLLAATQPTDEDEDTDAPEIQRINTARARLAAIIDYMRELGGQGDEDAPPSGQKTGRLR